MLRRNRRRKRHPNRERHSLDVSVFSNKLTESDVDFLIRYDIIDYVKDELLDGLYTKSKTDCNAK